MLTILSAHGMTRVRWPSRPRRAGRWPFPDAPPPLPGPRDLLLEPVRRGAGQHDREPGAAGDPTRPGIVAVGPAVGDRRLHAGAREPADARRLDRRPDRAAPHVPGGADAVRRRLAAVQPRAEHGLADRVP